MPLSSKAVVRVVFISLVLDLLAFTIPLPLFPRLIEFYQTREGSSPTTILGRTLALLHSYRTALASHTLVPHPSHEKKWDVVLLGGFLGSIFSICQAIISPRIGSLSDTYGRRRILLLSMVGNIVSGALWLQSTSFSSFLLSRLVGGLSEGNVQISLAIIGDVTTPATRSKSLMLVGLAFSLCFTIGPSLGAYFASRPIPATPLLAGRELNIYAFPAAIALALLVVETLYLYAFLPETRGWKVVEPTPASDKKKEETVTKPIVASLSERKAVLSSLRSLHLVFLLFFSGAEFTLSFLAYDLFGASNAENGRLLSYIGILSSILQGGYTRRSTARPLSSLAYRGILSTSLGLFLLALLPIYPSTGLLYAGATCLAFTSATVVTGLNSAASLLCDEETSTTGSSSSEMKRGRMMGAMRSSGQIGRAIGPIAACTLYWTCGPTVLYAWSGAALSVVAWRMRGLVQKEREATAVAKSKSE